MGRVYPATDCDPRMWSFVHRDYTSRCVRRCPDSCIRDWWVVQGRVHGVRNDISQLRTIPTGPVGPRLRLTQLLLGLRSVFHTRDVGKLAQNFRESKSCRRERLSWKASVEVSFGTLKLKTTGEDPGLKFTRLRCRASLCVGRCRRSGSAASTQGHPLSECPPQNPKIVTSEDHDIDELDKVEIEMTLQNTQLPPAHCTSSGPHVSDD